MDNRTKVVYRDKQSGRLITRHEAHQRDPSTWVREQHSIVVPGNHADDAHDYVVSSDNDSETS